MGPKTSSSLDVSAAEGLIALTSRCSWGGWTVGGEGSFSIGGVSMSGRLSECLDRCRLEGGGTSPGERDRL